MKTDSSFLLNRKNGDRIYSSVWVMSKMIVAFAVSIVWGLAFAFGLDKMSGFLTHFSVRRTFLNTDALQQCNLAF